MADEKTITSTFVEGVVTRLNTGRPSNDGKSCFGGVQLDKKAWLNKHMKADQIKELQEFFKESGVEEGDKVKIRLEGAEIAHIKIEEKGKGVSADEAFGDYGDRPQPNTPQKQRGNWQDDIQSFNEKLETAHADKLTWKTRLLNLDLAKKEAIFACDLFDKDGKHLFTAHGHANSENIDSAKTAVFYVVMAETRAIGRALRFYYGSSVIDVETSSGQEDED